MCVKDWRDDYEEIYLLVLDQINTQAAEQCFSWLKQYAQIISALGWLRAPVFLLILFHGANLARCRVRPTRIFDIVRLIIRDLENRMEFLFR